MLLRINLFGLCMGDFNFKVTRAEADFNNATGALNVQFWYPRNPNQGDIRIGPNTKFGMRALDDLLTRGHAVIANDENPISPPTAGSLPVFSDGVFACCRRDDGAGVHKLFHAGYSGFANTSDELFTRDGMQKLAARESAEEVIFVTRGSDPHLVTTDSLEAEIVKSATRLGLGDLPRRKVGERIDYGRDKLTVKYEDGEKLYEMPTVFTMLWNIDSSTIAMNLRHLDISSEEIYPIDAEGIFTDEGNGYRVHFNRESFLIDPKDIQGHEDSETLGSIGYGAPLRNVKVFRSGIDGKGRREVYAPLDSPLAYLGPGATPVNRPYLWAPQDTLRSSLDQMGVPGYEGKKLQWERKITERFHQAEGEGAVREKCVISPQYLVE